MYGSDLYRRLGVETGHDPGWREVGSLRLASSPARLEELTRQAGWAATFGLPLELISTERAVELFHGLFDPSGVLGAVHLPDRRPAQPVRSDDGARRRGRARGVEIATGTRVTGIGVVESHGRRRVGMSRPTRDASSARSWSTRAGSTATRSAASPASSCPSCRWPTSTRSPTEPERPARPADDARPDRLVYFREEVGGMIVGGYERRNSRTALRTTIRVGTWRPSRAGPPYVRLSAASRPRRDRYVGRSCF